MEFGRHCSGFSHAHQVLHLALTPPLGARHPAAGFREPPLFRSASGAWTANRFIGLSVPHCTYRETTMFFQQLDYTAGQQMTRFGFVFFLF